MSETILQKVEDLIADVDPFPAKPGGLVDQARKRMAAEAARAQEAENEAELVEQRAYKAVKTTEVFQAQTLTIAAGGWAPLLVDDPFRFRAVVCLLTAAATVVLAADQSNASGQHGFTLTPGICLDIRTRGPLYAANPGGSVIQVSVMAEKYAPEPVK
jgi:hypothetical protein